jgi:hypothetical protein
VEKVEELKNWLVSQSVLGRLILGQYITGIQIPMIHLFFLICEIHSFTQIIEFFEFPNKFIKILFKIVKIIRWNKPFILT